MSEHKFISFAALPSTDLERYPDLTVTQLALLRAMSTENFRTSGGIVRDANLFLQNTGYGWQLHHGTSTQLERLVEQDLAEKRHGSFPRQWKYRRSDYGLLIVLTNLEKARRLATSLYEM